jgi:hypothetical protein
VPPEALTGVSAISAGGGHSLAVKNGRVIAWGRNQYGQATVPAAAQTGVLSIAAGGLQSLAIRPYQPVSLPSAVTNLKARPLEASIRITWSAPADQGGATRVSYQYRVGNQDWVETTNTRAIIQGSPGRAITVSVRAVNEAGHGPVTRIKAKPR